VAETPAAVARGLEFAHAGGMAIESKIERTKIRTVAFHTTAPEQKLPSELGYINQNDCGGKKPPGYRIEIARQFLLADPTAINADRRLDFAVGPNSCTTRVEG